MLGGRRYVFIFLLLFVSSCCYILLSRFVVVVLVFAFFVNAFIAVIVIVLVLAFCFLFLFVVTFVLVGSSWPVAFSLCCSRCYSLFVPASLPPSSFVNVVPLLSPSL